MENPIPSEFSMRSVLVVDDDRLMRHYLSNQLKALGCRLNFASGAQEALQVMEVSQPDLVLLDIVLPGMDGFELCQRIKSDPRFQHVVVIHLTSLGRDAKDRNYSSGADDFLTKPPHMAELRARIRNHLIIKNLQGELVRNELGGREPEWDDGRPPQVLLAETHAPLRDHMKQLMEEMGCLVDAVDTLKDTIERLSLGLPDLVVLGQFFADGTGLAFSAHLRNFIRTMELPILLVCARKNMETEITEGESGPTDYLPKPFLPVEFRHRVNTLLRRGNMGAAFASRASASKHLVKDPATKLPTGAFLETHLGYLLAAGFTPYLLGFRLPATDAYRETAQGFREVVDSLRNVLEGGEALCRVSDSGFVVVLTTDNDEVARDRAGVMRFMAAVASVAMDRCRVGESAREALRRLADQLRLQGV